jgi:DNA-binding response OmpR family regulator
MPSILIIEDEITLRNALHEHLLQKEYKVLEAGDGSLGVEIALAQHPDLILLDVRLPKMDGMEALHILRQDVWGKHAKVIILSNFEPDYTSVGQVDQLNTDSPSYYLIKADNSLENIENKIAEVLNLRKADAAM